MLDSGATAGAFIDLSFAQRHNIPLLPLSTPRRLTTVDGSLSVAGNVTHYAELDLKIGPHLDSRQRFYATELHERDVILGHSWLVKHNPDINWATRTLQFNKVFCRRHCMPSKINDWSAHTIYCPSRTRIYTASESKDATTPHAHDSLDPTSKKPRRLNARLFHALAETHNTEVFSLSLYEIDKRLDELHVPLKKDDIDTKLYQVTLDAGYELSRQEGHGISLMEAQLADPRTLSDSFLKPEKPTYTLEDYLHYGNICEPPPPSPRQVAAQMHLSGASLEDIRIALDKLKRKKPLTDPNEKLPSQYMEGAQYFNKRQADILPPHRDCDHKIELKPGTIPPYGPLYNMSPDELLVLREYLKEQLDKGFIRASSSPAAAPVLFAKKPGGGLRFCVDYRALNDITIKNRYPIPLLQETLQRLSKAKYFTKLDVIAAFNRIRIREGDEWMTAFNTRYGLFETLVMPFGLCNAPATFQSRINEVLRPYLDIFCTAYIDDVLIYSETLQEHRKQVNLIIKVLGEAGLQLDIDKSEFEVQKVKYLGLIISTEGVRMDPEKVTAIDNWKEPGCLKDVQAFLGFANFYRRFIHGFGHIVKPLNVLARKGVKFFWSDACDLAFKTLKDAFKSAPVLLHYDHEKEAILECDSSDFVSAAVLSQYGNDGQLHPVAFMSKVFEPAECNYEIYDKELLAIVRAFETWRSELQGSAYPVTVFTDHSNLKYFMTTKQLSRRQVRWSEFLQQFDFVIKPVSGKSNAKVDALTRRSQDLPQDAQDARVRYQDQQLLKDQNLDPTCFSLSPADLEEGREESDDMKVARLIEEGYPEDSFWLRISKELNKEEGTPCSKEVALSECDIRDDRLFFRDRLYLPDSEVRVFVIQKTHDAMEGGHPGTSKLYELLSRAYWWPKMHQDVAQFVKACENCAFNKYSQQKYSGTLKPLPLPIQRWKDISVDFIGPIMLIDGSNAIMVVVDRLTKDRHIIPCHMKMTAQDLAWLFVAEVWKHHGLPDTIVSDRGSLFISHFWKSVCFILGISLSLSTAYQPQTDGQTEIANKWINQFLRQYVDYAQTNWKKLLPMAEFAMRNAVNSSTGMSPFFANHGYHPRMTFGPPRPIPRDSPAHLQLRHNEALEFTQKMDDILSMLRANLSVSKDRMEEFANAHRRPAPAYRVGDMVLLSTKNITSTKPIPKFDHKYIGPYRVIQVINSHAYKLQLPYELTGIHPVFHTSRLKPAPGPPLPGQTNPPIPPISIDIDGQALWAVDEILDSRRTSRKGFEYLIQWRGYDPKHNSWEPLVNVIGARASRQDFEKRFPTRPLPTKREIEIAIKQQQQWQQEAESSDESDGSGDPN